MGVPERGFPLDENVKGVHFVNMVHAGRRERRRTERSSAFREAALALIREDGLDGLTLPKLAKEADAAVGAVYRYFPSKEALFADLQSALLVDLAGWLRALDEELAKKSALCRILAAARFYGRLPETIGGRFDLIAAAIGDPRTLVPTELAGPVIAAAGPLFAHLASLLRAAEIEDPEERAIVLWASLHGVVQIRKLERASDLIDTARLERTLVRSLLAGWGAGARALTTAERQVDRLFEDGTLAASIVEGGT